MAESIPSGPDALTANWIEQILRDAGELTEGIVSSIRVEPFAHGVGLLGKLVRVHVEYRDANDGPPPSLVVKFPSESPDNVALCEAIKLYWREHQFYTRCAEETPLRVPRVFHASMSSLRQFVLALEDLVRGTPGNQIAGATPEQVRRATVLVADHHAAFFGEANAGSRDWLPRLDDPEICAVVSALTGAGAKALTQHLGECFTDETRGVALALGDKIPALSRSICSGNTTFVHGDFRVDNLVFASTRDDPPLTVVDWQICYEACPPYDIAYFMTQSVEPEVRRGLERDVLTRYHERLCEKGVTGYDFETCFEDYRKATTYCLCYPLIAAGTLDLSNERGRELGKMMLRRSLTAIENVDAAALLAQLD